MNSNSFSGVCLKDGEKIISTAKLSKWSLLISWLSIPSVFVVYFLFFRLPDMIYSAIKGAAIDAVKEKLEIDEILEEVFPNVSAGLLEGIFGNIPIIVYVLLSIPVIMLILAWLGWCLYQTRRHFRCHLTVTDFRVIGKSNEDELVAPLAELKNVYIEKSIWGRLFNYGSLVIQTRTKTVTFKEIHNPMEIRNILISYVDTIY